MLVHRILPERFLVRSVIAREVAGRKMSFSRCFRVTAELARGKKRATIIEIVFLYRVLLDEKNLFYDFFFLSFFLFIYNL